MIFIGQGVDSLLQDLILVDSLVNRPILTFWPAYPFIEHSINMLNRHVLRVSLNNDGGYPDLLSEKIINSAPDIAVIVNPTNPGGVNITCQKLMSYMMQLPNTRFIIDESYIDFDHQKTLLDLVSQDDRIVILRGFSKGYGLPGLRVGVAISRDVSLIKKLHDERMYFFNPLSVEGVIKAVTHKTYFKETIRKNLEIKSMLIGLFKEIEGLNVIDTITNYFLVRHSSNICRNSLKQKCLDNNVEFWWFDETPFFKRYFGDPPVHPSLYSTFRVSPVIDKDIQIIKGFLSSMVQEGISS